MTTVHENTLNDLVYPAEIVGKRTRVKLDGSKLIKVHLDKAQQTNVEHKVIFFIHYLHFENFLMHVHHSLIKCMN